MPQQTKIFRVFVSSTFTDMKEERRLLQKKVFPALEKFCEKNNARFQGVDLRWGVNEESQLNQKTLDICLNEIARCQRISPKPNFLILMGNKYGWQPLPTKIPKKEWDDFQMLIDPNGKEYYMNCISWMKMPFLLNLYTSANVSMLYLQLWLISLVTSKTLIYSTIFQSVKILN